MQLTSCYKIWQIEEWPNDLLKSILNTNKNKQFMKDSTFCTELFRIRESGKDARYRLIYLNIISELMRDALKVFTEEVKIGGKTIKQSKTC